MEETSFKGTSFAFVESRKTRHFISPHHVSSKNLKITNHRHISLTGIDHCKSKFSKDIKLEKNHSSF